MRLTSTLLKNAVSNLLRGGTTAAVNLALPHFLTKSMDVDRFSAWSLMLQIAAYSSFLDFGLQTAVGRFVAQATELGLAERRKKLIETSYSMFVLTALLAMISIGAVIFEGRHIFNGLPESLLREFRIAGIILGGGAALQLTFAPFTGVLVGLHKNELPAITTIVSRLGGAFVAIVLARHSHSLILLATAITVANLAAGVIQFAAVVHFLPEVRKMRLKIDAGIARELLRFCAGLGFLTLSMFLIQGLDIAIVGRFQFNAVGYYTIAASVIAIMVGFNNAILNAFMAPLAVFHARLQNHRIASTTLDATWGTSFANGAVLLFFILFGRAIVDSWVGAFYSNLAAPILLVLLVAQTIRLMAGPLTTALIACDLHANAVASGLAEGIVNLVLSLYLMRVLGAIGVAYGTLIGSVISLLVHLLYTLPRTQDIPIGPFELLYSGIGLPVLALLPIIVFSMTELYGSLHRFRAFLLASLLMTFLTTAWSWRLQRLTHTREVA